MFAFCLEDSNEVIIEGRKRIEERLPAIFRYCMNHQVTILITADFHPGGIEPEFLGNPHGLAVTVHEDSTALRGHVEHLRVYEYVCILVSEQSAGKETGAPYRVGAKRLREIRVLATVFEGEAAPIE